MELPTNKYTLISSMSILFYTTKFFGVVPYGCRAYYKKKIFKVSIIGNICVILLTLGNLLSSHIESSAVSSSESDVGGSGTLTKIIGVVLMYMDPIMLMFDVGGFIINQKKLMDCIDTMQDLDARLQKENITIDYRHLRRLTVVLIAVITIFESGIVAYNYVLLKDTVWFAPIYVSTVSKVWYVALVYNIKQKFVAINLHFEKLQKIFIENKRQVKTKNALNKMKKNKLEDHEQIGYLHREILVKRTRPNQKVFASKLEDDILRALTKENYDELDTTNTYQTPTNKEISIQRATVGDKLDKKLTNLCQLHFEIAEISKVINQMFSFQTLLLMAYGFMAITARIYFVYTGLAGQNIPNVFRSAQSPRVSIIFIAYTAAKCATVIMMSWKTKIDGQKTGVYVHKVANAIDEDHCYKTVKHFFFIVNLLFISFVKIACGFFELDMSTLYAITGAVTSYIIILIQFNLAYQRNKNPTDNSTTTNTTFNLNSTI